MPVDGRTSDSGCATQIKDRVADHPCDELADPCPL
jgi:hypothetical protein